MDSSNIFSDLNASVDAYLTCCAIDPADSLTTRKALKRILNRIFCSNVYQLEYLKLGGSVKHFVSILCKLKQSIHAQYFRMGKTNINSCLNNLIKLSSSLN